MAHRSNCPTLKDPECTCTCWQPPNRTSPYVAREDALRFWGPDKVLQLVQQGVLLPARPRKGYWLKGKDVLP
jgi:hypothetical protein